MPATVDAKTLEHDVETLPARTVRKAVESREEFEVRRGAESRIEAVESAGAVPDKSAHLGCLGDNVMTQNECLSARRQQQRREYFEQSGLACAVRTEQSYNGARRNFEVHVAQHGAPRKRFAHASQQNGLVGHCTLSVSARDQRTCNCLTS